MTIHSSKGLEFNTVFIVGVEKGYYPDFYVKDYKCFIEVKHPYFVEEQNKNGKIDIIDLLTLKRQLLRK